VTPGDPPASAATALIGVMAVAFGTNLLSFVHTYEVAERAEASRATLRECRAQLGRRRSRTSVTTAPARAAMSVSSLR